MGTIMASWRMLGCRTYIARVQVPLTTIGERAGSCAGQVSSESTPRRSRRRCSYGRAPSQQQERQALEAQRWRAVHLGRHCAPPYYGEVGGHHVSSDRNVNECKNIFRLSSARRTNSSLDCEDKEIWLMDHSVRARKKLVRGGGNYSCRSSMLMFSSSSLVPNCVPECRYEGIGAHNTTDALGLFQALRTAPSWHEPRTARNPKHKNPKQ
jgi:hypothetical protein